MREAPLKPVLKSAKTDPQNSSRRFVSPEHCAQGGRVKASESEAKAQALRRLHSLRRGRRLNDPGISSHEYTALLADTMHTVREPEPGVRSIRMLAKHCRVDARTVRRWLSGKSQASSISVRAIQSWLRQF